MEILVIMCALVAYFFWSLSLSLFGYSLTCSSCFAIANLENLCRYINLSGILDSRNLKKIKIKNGDGCGLYEQKGGHLV